MKLTIIIYFISPNIYHISWFQHVIIIKLLMKYLYLWLYCNLHNLTAHLVLNWQHILLQTSHISESGNRFLFDELMPNTLSGSSNPVEDVWGSGFPSRLEGTSLPHLPAAEQHTGPLEGDISAQCIFQGCSWDWNQSSCLRSRRMESTNMLLMVASEQDLLKRRKLQSSRHRHWAGVKSPLD